MVSPAAKLSCQWYGTPSEATVALDCSASALSSSADMLPAPGTVRSMTNFCMVVAPWMGSTRVVDVSWMIRDRAALHIGIHHLFGGPNRGRLRRSFSYEARTEHRDHGDPAGPPGVDVGHLFDDEP